MKNSFIDSMIRTVARCFFLSSRIVVNASVLATGVEQVRLATPVARRWFPFVCFFLVISSTCYEMLSTFFDLRSSLVCTHI